MSLANSIGGFTEDLLYAKRIQREQINEPPLFILGHWRSGTTHLHNLLAIDDRQFAFPNTYQVVSPFTFLTTEMINTRLFKWLLPATRPMDNMAMSFTAPQEDELALCMHSLRSLYLTISFPRRESHYARFLTFEHAEPGDARRWQDALVWFVQKLTYKYRRAILLKSPCHTARIKLILDVFPEARFVHIHRNPYDVFRSSQRYWDTATWYTYLQRPDRSRVDDDILQRYVTLYDAFFRERSLIPAGRYHEMCFENLECDAVQEIGQLYDALDMDGFQSVRPQLTQYVESLQGYQKNQHAGLPKPLRKRVANSWQRCFEEWGYDV